MSDPGELLEHAAWLRRLAASLVGDGADDVVQDTWLAALRSPPSPDRPARPWLGRVVRNAARFRWRSDANRTARERAIAATADDTAPSSAELLERHETQQLLGRLVGELEEPYREAILLRYAEGLTPSQIAKRLGAPAGTIRWRIKEGLDRLRARLDAAHRGDRRAWIAALAPLVPRSSAPLVMLAAAAAVVLIALLIVPRGEHSAVPAARPPAPAHAIATRPAGVRAPEATSWLAQPEAPSRRLAGRVTKEGVPVRGALVRAVAEAAAVEQITGDDGRFDFGERPAGVVTVAAALPRTVAAIRSVDLRDPRARFDDLELALTECVVSLAGRVQDSAGTPIAGARLLREDVIGATSDATGAYELCVLPTAAAVEQLRLTVRADGYGAITMLLAPKGHVHRDLVLAPEAALAGRVVANDGAAVAFAPISIEPDDDARRLGYEPPAPASVRSDAAGAWRVAGLRGGRYRVSAPGAEAVLVEIAPGASADVALHAGGMGAVRGRVSSGGGPVAGARISLRGAPEPSALSQADGSFVLAHVPSGHVALALGGYALRDPVELDVRAGAETHVVLEAVRLASIHGTVRAHGLPVTNARVDIGGPTKLELTANAHGEYAASGLTPGAYWIYGDDTRLGTYVTQDFAIAGTEDLVLDLDLSFGASVRGIVVDRRGRPLPGVNLRITGGDHETSRCLTDDTGRFTCGSLVGAGRYSIAAYGMGGVVPFSFAQPPPDLVLSRGDAVVDNVRLVVDPADRAISGVVTDLDGAPLSDVDVFAIGPGDVDGWSQHPHALTSPSGAFRIDGLAATTYDVEVRTSRGVTRTRQGIAGGTTNLTVAIDPRPCVLPAAGDPASRPAATVRWADRLELVGWTLPAHARPGDPFEIAITYKVFAPLDRSWKTFVHLAGPAWINVDHEPVGGTCPTALWQPGTVIVDRFTVTATTSGPYEVRIGFYISGTTGFTNLEVSSAPPDMRAEQDAIRLGTIPVD